MHLKGFDRGQYLEEQSRYIIERINAYKNYI